MVLQRLSFVRSAVRKEDSASLGMHRAVCRGKRATVYIPEVGCPDQAFRSSGSGSSSRMQ